MRACAGCDDTFDTFDTFDTKFQNIALKINKFILHFRSFIRNFARNMTMKKENSGEIVMYQPEDINTHFLRVDDEVYHIGASIKDLGKKWFAFTLMHDITPSMLAEHLSEKGGFTPPIQPLKNQQLTYNRCATGVSGQSSGILCSPSVRCLNRLCA